MRSSALSTDATLLERRNESGQRANLAVNPAYWLQMAASSFTPNPAGGTTAPIYVSTDGGATSVLNPIIPSAS